MIMSSNESDVVNEVSADFSFCLLSRAGQVYNYVSSYFYSVFCIIVEH
jgi:hypothetical protein